MKKIIISILVILVIIISLFIFNKDKNIIELSSDLISEQIKIDEEIRKYINEDYKIDNPKIINNPYKISPLTSLIIFNDSNSVDVYLNNNYLYTSTNYNHLIPIYGLINNKDNIIKLVSNNNEYIYNIKPSIDSIKFDINKSNNDIYFTSYFNNENKYIAFNGLGEVIWNLDINSQSNIYPLDNGNFLVFAPEYINNGNVSFFTSILEVDYLGKIIKRYDTLYGAHHYLKVIDNYAFVLGSKESGTPMSIIYKLNLDNGVVEDKLDLDELFINISDSWVNILNKLYYGYDVNSIDYKDGNMLISIRNLNMIMEVNFNKKKLNYIFTNESDILNILGDYNLSGNNLIYPVGCHDINYYNDYITIFNNNMDYYNGLKKSVKDIKGTSNALIYKVDDKSIKLIKKYDGDTSSYAFGSFKNGNLINYSYMFKNNNELLSNPSNTYSRIVEYNKDNIVLDMKTNNNLYQVVKGNFIYKDYELKDYKYYSDNNYIDNDINIKNVDKLDNILNITNNYIECNLSNYQYKTLNIIFIGKKKYNIPYKGIRKYYSIDDGIYKVYVLLDGKYYDLGYSIKKKSK